MSKNNNLEDITLDHCSFRLFDEPSFLDGFISIIDFRNLIERYHADRTGKEADHNSIKADWQAVGNDIRHAFAEYESSTSSRG